MVQTARLRPALLPALCGRAFFLAGYRIFVRRGHQRGLYILRAHTDRRLLRRAGNLCTRCRYRLSDATMQARRADLLRPVRTPDGAAGLDLAARPDAPGLPVGSPFAGAREASR